MCERRFVTEKTNACSYIQELIDWREVVRAWRLPVLKRTHAEISIPEALKRVFEVRKKMAPQFLEKMGQFWPIYA